MKNKKILSKTSAHEKECSCRNGIISTKLKNSRFAMQFKGLSPNYASNIKQI